MFDNLSVGTLPWWAWSLIVAVGAGVTLFVLFQKRCLPLPEFLKQPFERLLDEQIVMDELSGSEIVRHAQSYTVPVQILLVKCTQKWLSKLGYRPPEGIDSEHNIIMIVTEKISSGKILKVQLVSFGSMEEKLATLFRGKDEILLTQ